MKRFVSNSLLVLMVSALIAVSNYNTYAQRGDRPMRDSAQFERGIPNLTAEQKTKIQALRIKLQKEVTPLRNELVEKKAHLRTLESAEKPDINAINKTIDEISTLQSKIMKLKASHRVEIASNLTDEQKVFFNSHQGKMKGERGHGRGMGKGNRGNNCPNPNCPNK